MSVMSSSGWGSRRSKSRFAPASQINVTPFVDVMLVLLIVFMVAAPLMAVTVPVELAKSAAKPKADAAPLTIAVAGDGTIVVGATPVSKESLVATIQKLSHGSTDQRIYLSGAKDVSYQQVMDIMGLIDAAGFTRIGLMGASGN
jgi:biopolymer transport protein TolR